MTNDENPAVGLSASNAGLGDWRDNLSSLPNIGDSETRMELLQNGETILHRIILPFVAWKFNSADPVMFTDEDGSWFVVYGHHGGPHKRCA